MPTRPKIQHTYPQRKDSGFEAKDYRSRPEYHTARWARMRRIFLAQREHVFCVRCKAQGRFTAASVVAHIIPAEICGNFWDTSNWQPLCKKCNAVKAAEDKRMIQEHHQGVGASNLCDQSRRDPAPSLENTQPKFQKFQKTE